MHQFGIEKSNKIMKISWNQKSGKLIKFDFDEKS